MGGTSEVYAHAFDELIPAAGYGSVGECGRVGSTGDQGQPSWIEPPPYWTSPGSLGGLRGVLLRLGGKRVGAVSAHPRHRL